MLRNVHNKLLFSRKLYYGLNTKVIKCFSTSSMNNNEIISWKALYRRHGSVTDVLELEKEILSFDKENKDANNIFIKFLAAPINPADFNMIEGVYSIKPNLPAIGGNEGVAVITNIGNNIQHLNIGDYVIPKEPGFGTWRTHAICSADEMSIIPNDIPAEYAANIAVNPCTAYRLLRDFISLKPGDVICQNGANSAVGQSIIQMARDMNIKTINIIRNRDQLSGLVEHLKSLGADYVFTDDEIPRKMNKIVKNPIKLALNCIGGRASAQLANLLDDQGILVTYGGMSKKPVQIQTGRLIFNDIQAKGFWLSRWIKQNNEQQRLNMIHDIAQSIRQNKFKIKMKKLNFTDNFEHAIKEARKGYRNKKVVFTFDQ